VSHLDDARLVELRAAAPSDEERAHLDGCEACRTTLARVRAALDAGAVEGPSVFETRGALRALESSISAEVHQRRGSWRPRRVALVAAVAAFSGAAFAYGITRPPAPVLETQPAPAPEAPAAVAPAPAPAPVVEPAPEPTEPTPKPAVRARRPSPAPLPVLEPCAPGWAEIAAARAARGEPAASADAWIKALCGAEARVAANALQSMVRAGTVEAHEVTERIDANDAARGTLQGLRLPCAFGLRYDGDASAIDRCDAFFSAHPSDPAVRELALAAGVVAERNGLHERALASYDRASTPALLRKAQLGLKLGRNAEARADLTRYLDARPDARARPAVRELARKLGL
jgi:hypothetical protein